MKKTIALILTSLSMTACSNQAISLVKAEKITSEKRQLVGAASFHGCMAAVVEEAKLRKDPMVVMMGQPFCLKVAFSVIDETAAKTNSCSDTDKECFFLAGCVKASFGIDGYPKTEKAEKTMANKCLAALVLKQDEDKKDSVVNRNK